MPCGGAIFGGGGLRDPFEGGGIRGGGCIMPGGRPITGGGPPCIGGGIAGPRIGGGIPGAPMPTPRPGPAKPGGGAFIIGVICIALPIGYALPMPPVDEPSPTRRPA